MKKIFGITAAVAALAITPLSAEAALNASGSGKLQTLNRLVNSEVRATDNTKIGKVDNVVLDLESGHVLFALVKLDGENKRVALPPGVFSSANQNQVRLNITKDRVTRVPGVEGEITREKAGQASYVHKIYKEFDQQFWWQGSDGADQGSFHNVQPGKQLIGKDIVNVQDKKIGDVRNALIDLPAGRIVYVVMQPLSEIGTKLYALPPSALTLYKDGKSLATDLDKEKMANAPSFAPNDQPSLYDRGFASKVYEHYGKRAYFETGSDSGLSATGGWADRTYQQSNGNASSQDNSNNQQSNSSSDSF